MAACDVYLNCPDRFSNEMAGSQLGYCSGAPSIQEEMMFEPLGRRGSRSVGGSSNDLSSPSRRAEMLQEYFKSTNALNRSIMLEKTSVEKEHTHWSVLSDSRRDEIVDQHFVPEDVRMQYEGGLIGGPAYAWNVKSQKLSDQKYYSQSQSTLDDWDTSESIDGVSMQPLSQPIEVKRKAKSVKDNNRLAPTSPQMFVRNKLRSFSSRSKKGMRLKSNSPGDGTVVADEIIPLFERDVHELDNDVDLPDDSLLRDHMEDQEADPSFARLKPLRYSFGRKLRHKVDQGSSSDVSNSCIIYNQDVNSLSMQDLSLGVEDNLRASSPDIAIINTSPEPERDPISDSRALATSPPSMVSDDPSCISPSRQSVLTPDSTQNVRCKSRNLESPLKHPLIRSTRAGSSYMTVTSQFADRRQQLKANSVRRKVNSTIQAEETAPTVSPLESQTTIPPTVVVPMTKVSSTSDSMATDSTTSSDPLSPLSSPPPSPAGVNYHRTNRESGYMSSTYASDEEEIPKPVQLRHKRRSRQMVVSPRH